MDTKMHTADLLATLAIFAIIFLIAAGFRWLP